MNKGLRPIRLSDRPTDINEKKKRLEDEKAARRAKLAEAYVVPVGTLLGYASEVEFLVHGCIPKGNVGLITGESGGGKSWIAYDLVRAVATATKWMTRGCSVETPQTVCVFNYDNPTNTLAARFVRLGFTENLPVLVHTHGHTKPLDGLPEILTLPSNRKHIKFIIEHYRPALVLLDSFRQMHESDENDSKEMKVVMSIMKEWTSINDCTVIAIHHTSKSGGSKWEASARGSGEIISSAGFVIEVRKAEAKNLSGAAGTLHWTKHQAWPIGQTCETAFEVVDEDDREGSFTTVRATSALPGEIESAFEQKILKALAESGHPATREQIWGMLKGTPRPIVNRTLNRLLGRNKLVYRHKPSRTYSLA